MEHQQKMDQQMDQQGETRVEESSPEANAAEHRQPAATDAEMRPSDAEMSPSDADMRPSDAEMRPSHAETSPSDADTRPSDAEMGPDERAPAATHDLDAGDVRARWASIQASFVDDPMGAVRQADQLTEATLEQLAGRHRQLRDEMGRGSDSEGSQTELARKSLQNYRSLLQGMIGVDSAHHGEQARN